MGSGLILIGMPPSNRQQWYADVLRAGLDTAIFDESDILVHATPAVLIGSLPKDVLVKLLDATLATGAMSPEAVVQTANPDILAEHAPEPVIWSCFVSAAERAGIPGDGPPSSGSREFLRRVLEQSLAHGVATPRDVVEDVNARVIGHHFPDDLTTKLLEASLSAGRMTPELILETLGVESIAKHAPTKVVWSCLVRTGAPTGAAAASPAAGSPASASSAAEPAAQAQPPAQASSSQPSSSPSTQTSAPSPAVPAIPAPPPPQAAAPPAPASAPVVGAAAVPAGAYILSANQKSALELFDEEPAMVVEIDDSSGTMEVTRDKEEPALAAAPGAGDEKKKSVSKHTTKRA
jgi:hypothetical protein